MALDLTAKLALSFRTMKKDEPPSAARRGDLIEPACAGANAPGEETHDTDATARLRERRGPRRARLHGGRCRGPAHAWRGALARRALPPAQGPRSGDDRGPGRDARSWRALGGIAHFIDQQLSVPAEEALLEARIMNVRPPCANFYRAAIGAVNRASQTLHGRKFADLSTVEQRDFVNLMRQNKIDGWQGPAGGFVYFLLRSDAVDVVYGTVEGYEALGIPYMPHIAPDRRW